MKYKTIDLLDARIERIISANVKHYYTDWKNYDRPKYMRLKGSNDRTEKEMILIARECGTYLITDNDMRFSTTYTDIIDYYFNQEYTKSKFFFIDLINLECRKLNDNEIKKFIHDMNKYWDERKETA